MAERALAPVHGFNAKQHVIDLGGSDYLEVKWRVAWFRNDHPEGRIDTEMIASNDKWAHYRAVASFPHVIGNQVEWALGSGHGQGFANANKHGAKFHERAETTAIGRALAALGYGTQFCDDFEEGEDLADAPVERNTKRPSGSSEGPIEINRTRARGGTSDGPTDKQIKLVFALARETGMDDDDIDALAREHGADSLKSLSRRQVSKLIERLQELRDNPPPEDPPSIPRPHAERNERVTQPHAESVEELGKRRLAEVEDIIRGHDGWPIDRAVKFLRGLGMSRWSAVTDEMIGCLAEKISGINEAPAGLPFSPEEYAAMADLGNEQAAEEARR